MIGKTILNTKILLKSLTLMSVIEEWMLYLAIKKNNTGLGLTA